MAYAEDTPARELIEKSFATIAEEASLASVLGKFETGTETIFVFDDSGNFKGTLTESHVMKTNTDPAKTKVKSLCFHTPKILENESILKAARLMIENDAKKLPVFNENGQMIGTLSADAILREASRTRFGKTSIEEACSKNPVTASEKTSIGEAFNILREKNISHLPVVDKKGLGIGMIAMHDITTKYFSPKRRARRGEIISEKTRELSLPVSNIMSYPLAGVFEKENIRKAVQKLLEKKISGLAVLDSWGRVSGIATKTDILQHLLKEEKEKPVITFSYAKGQELREIDEIELEHIKKDFEGFARKYGGFLGKGQAFIYVKKHKEKTRKLSLYDTRVRILTPRGLIAAHANGFGLIFAVHNALEKIRRQTEKKRGREKTAPWQKER